MHDVGEQLRAQRAPDDAAAPAGARRRGDGWLTRPPRRSSAGSPPTAGRPLAPSTVYRALEALEELGVVGHTHLDHRAPSYHLADHADHIHLVCRDCGRVEQCPPSSPTGFTGNVLGVNGFVADVTHMAIHGRCSSCATR